MEIDLRQPNISGSDHEMLLGLKSYLFQLREQLQWAFDNLEAGSGGSGGASGTGTVINVNQTGTTPSGPSFTEIKDYIIKQADEVIAKYDEALQTTLSETYAAKSDIGTYVENVETTVTQTAKDLSVEVDARKAIIFKDGDVITVGDKGFINIGLLRTETVGQTEVSVIGIALGQTSSDENQKYAEFLPDGITFFDANKNKVAHMGDRRLTSPNVRANTTMSIGDLVDTVEGEYIITKWEG